MDWEKIYSSLIKKAKSQNRVKSSSIYYENHHIVPKHIGGTNEITNLVLLTFREHYLAHYILWRIYKRPQDKIAYLMRSNQKEEAQRIRVNLAVSANRSTGKGFLNFKNKNPMKNKNTVQLALATKRLRYGPNMMSDKHYDNVVKQLIKISKDPIIREKTKHTHKLNILKLSKEELQKKYGQPSDKNPNYGWIKGEYKVIDPVGRITYYTSQSEIIRELGVSQSTLVRKRNTGLINCKSTNPQLKKWNNWQFIYYKKPHPKTGTILSEYKTKNNK
jgi:hypothetical protein